ncbi:hypothetical protein EXIGLDRAFT_39948 [Exidia glandulosa HHB12029]|uniref:Uncharacterized protein n=1 Tax=Exidia glandulosa HHB12029 TaxID=1314781 RepID=A0A165INX5_EXIGL|nr:hypothetical protein EXIGLDRAFT_39948 [Exidia glandulosa HHB12029]
MRMASSCPSFVVPLPSLVPHWLALPPQSLSRPLPCPFPCLVSPFPCRDDPRIDSRDAVIERRSSLQMTGFDKRRKGTCLSRSRSANASLPRVHFLASALVLALALPPYAHAEDFVVLAPAVAALSRVSRVQDACIFARARPVQAHTYLSLHLTHRLHSRHCAKFKRCAVRTRRDIRLLVTSPPQIAS